jgi:2-oxoglutarate dehydrogenase E1 component
MERSLEVPTATTQRQIPIKLLDENRRLINAERAAAELPKVSFTHLVSWAVIQALRAFPGMNDAYAAAAGEPTRVRRPHIRFGLAVDVPSADGSRSLLVPKRPRRGGHAVFGVPGRGRTTSSDARAPASRFKVRTSKARLSR